MTESKSELPSSQDAIRYSSSLLAAMTTEEEANGEVAEEKRKISELQSALSIAQRHLASAERRRENAGRNMEDIRESIVSRGLDYGKFLELARMTRQMMTEMGLAPADSAAVGKVRQRPGRKPKSIVAEEAAAHTANEDQTIEDKVGAGFEVEGSTMSAEAPESVVAQVEITEPAVLTPPEPRAAFAAEIEIPEAPAKAVEEHTVEAKIEPKVEPQVEEAIAAQADASLAVAPVAPVMLRPRRAHFVPPVTTDEKSVEQAAPAENEAEIESEIMNMDLNF